MATPRRISVSEVRIGDRIDLAGDAYADPDGSSMFFDCELALVGGVIRETPSCTVLCIEGVDWFGFPPDHVVTLDSHDDAYVAE